MFDGSAGAGTSQTRSLSGPSSVAASGTLGSLSVTTAEALSVGDTASYAPLSVGYTATVFSGNGHWTGGNGSSTSWGLAAATTNWTDMNGSGVHAAPGTFQNFNDTAAFDDIAGSNTTITLDGAMPTLSVLTFNTTGGRSYDLEQGSGTTSLVLSNGTAAAAVVAVLSGTHTISAPITLSSSGAFDLADNTQLGVSGAISNGANGPMPVSLSGGGTLVLAGPNNYSGGTYVNAGTLVAVSNTALADGTSLIVGAGGTFIFDPTVSAAASGEAASGAPASAAMVAPVPEPGTIALLVAALWGAAIYRRFRRSLS